MTGMFLFQLHSGLRYLILLAGLATIAYALHGSVKKRPHDTTMKRLAITFRALMDVTLFVGVAMVFTGYGFYNDLGVHILLMVLATAVSHLVPAVMRRRPQAERTLTPYAVATAAALGLVVVGTLAIHRPILG